jgi:Icc-related predicted phosphoesterase
VALHGHIHESRGVARIGRTACINPGSTYAEGVLDGCIVTLRGDKVRNAQLVRG